jgi:uncharacterized protein (TIGR02757 family)
MKPDKASLREILLEKADVYNRPTFIESDPISIPHFFSKPADIEIAGFLAATIAWGQRKTLIQNARELMRRMDFAPHDFIVHHSQKERLKFSDFVHRTFNGEDAVFFLERLQVLYAQNSSMEHLFCSTAHSVFDGILQFRSAFLGNAAPQRHGKHVANPADGSAAKRLNMFLRWMVRNDSRGVDFGIWKTIKPSQLYIPLDVHSGRVARMLGILSRKQDDWTAVEELTAALREFDAQDPIRFDYALFGMGVNERHSINEPH